MWVTNNGKTCYSEQEFDELKAENKHLRLYMNGAICLNLCECNVLLQKYKQALEEIRELIQIHFNESCMTESCYYKSNCGDNCYPKRSGKVDYCCYYNAIKIEKKINEVLTNEQ